FIRGVEQVAAICREVKAFESAQAYGVTTKREVRASGQIEYKCFAVERQAPSDRWPLLLGDAIHNLRASLDHAVYTASGGATGTQFPITRSASDFHKHGRPRIARGLDAFSCAAPARTQTRTPGVVGPHRLRV